MLLLIYSHLAHLLSMFLDIDGAICKFIEVLQRMRNITLEGSDVREIGMNTMWNKLRTCMWDI